MKNYKKIFFGYLFVFLISTPLYSTDDECDILCRSGVQPQDSSKNKSKPKTEVKKKTYDKPKYYSSYNRSNLIINSTESTKKDITDIKNWIYKNADLSSAPFDIDVDFTSSYGVKDSFRIGNLNFSFIDNYYDTKYEIVSIGSLACNGSVFGYGINETRPIELILKELVMPTAPKRSEDYSCKIDNISLDYDGIGGINGESKETLLYELERETGSRKAAKLVLDLFEDIDVYYEGVSSYNENIIRSQIKNVISFGNSSFSVYLDADSETDLSILYEIFSEAKIFLTTVVGRNLMNELANAQEVIPLDVYKKIAMTVAENQYEDRFYEASERFVNSFENLGIDLDNLEASYAPGLSKIYKISFGVNWSNELFREIAYASGGTIDAALLAAKGFTVNKMNKYEIQMLLQSAGLDRNLQGLYLDYAYTLYDQIYEQAKIFINNPKGLLLELEFPLGLDEQIFYEIEKNPMMAFNVLNNMEFSITANPVF